MVVSYAIGFCLNEPPLPIGLLLTNDIDITLPNYVYIKSSFQNEVQ